MILEKKIFITDSAGLNNEDAKQYHLPDINNNTIAYLQYTSGSISEPKAVIIQHSHLIHSLFNNIKIWEYSEDSVTLTWAPHNHIFGLVCGLLVPLLHGSIL